MVRKLFSAALIALAAGFSACDKDGDLKPGDVPVGVQQIFNKMVLADGVAWDAVKWEKDRLGYKAEFRNEAGVEVEMWFNDSAWLRTETDVRRANLPQYVIDKVAAEHPGYSIDDADLVQEPGATYYELELEKDGKRDKIVRIDATGTTTATYYHTPVGQLPSAVERLFSQMFPGRQAKWEVEPVGYKAEFRNESGAEVEAWFSATEWLRTETEVHASQLPSSVAASARTAHPDYAIDDVYFVEVPGAAYYEIELEKDGSHDITVRIGADGNAPGGTQPSGQGMEKTTAQQLFAQMFPGKSAEWEREKYGFKAEFRNADGTETEVLFGEDGWMMTETEVWPQNLPTAVLEYIKANHPGFYVDDAELVEIPGGRFYGVELEKKGAKDIKLRIREDGSLW